MIAWAGLMNYMSENPDDGKVKCVAFETADPAKFPDDIRKITGTDPKMPDKMIAQQSKEEYLKSFENTYEDFKAFLKSKFL